MARAKPLALPRGSVRAIVTIMLTASAIAMVFAPINDKEFATGLFALAGFCIRDYFATRQEQEAQEEPEMPEPLVMGDDR